jgi:hypothetical protein
VTCVLRSLKVPLQLAGNEEAVEQGVLAEDRHEDPAPFLGQRNGANAAIALAFHTTDQPLLVKSIDCNTEAVLSWARVELI